LQVWDILGVEIEPDQPTKSARVGEPQDLPKGYAAAREMNARCAIKLTPR
jgi:hypothetical protein